MNDVSKYIYGALVLFVMVLAFWFSIIWVSACGFTFTCNKAPRIVVRTPIPTLIPRVGTLQSNVGLPTAASTQGAATFDRCQVVATDLIGAWVTAGHPNEDAFPFTDIHGESCEGTFAADIHPLLTENSVWAQGSIGCVSCHNADLTERSAGLDLSSYDAMLMGSQRADANAEGTDIFGDGDWQTSILHDVLVNQSLVPEGHQADTPDTPVLVYAGHRVADVEAEGTVTVTPTP